MDYIVFILHRMFSGILNGLGYIKDIPGVKALSSFLILGTIFMLYHSANKHWRYMKRWKKVLFIAGTIATIASIVFVAISFINPMFILADIHLWTFATQTFLAATEFIASNKFFENFWWLLLTVSPSVFLQKLFINLISGYKWDYVGTDVESGKYWSLKLFKLKVPRIANMKLKLLLAILSVVLFVGITIYKNKHEKTNPTFRPDIVSTFDPSTTIS